MCHDTDFMNDVFAFSHPDTLRLTGLTNPQIMRNAEVAGIYGVTFVHGKRPSEVVMPPGRGVRPAADGFFILYVRCLRPAFQLGLKELVPVRAPAKGGGGKHRPAAGRR
ncbi:hypothetical protein DFAR_440013 [Desulfarculales bacterium]